MKVHVYTQESWRSNPRGEEVIDAMAAGAKMLGHDVRTVRQGDDFEPADLGIIWGITSKRHYEQTKHRDGIIKRYKRYATGWKPIIVCERGYVRRDEYHSVGLDWIGGRGHYRNTRCAPDRWDALGVKLQPPAKHDGRVLICAQVPHDTSCQHHDQEEWIASVVEMYGVENVIVRPHPLYRRFRVPKGVDVSQFPALEDDFKRARLVVTFSSTAGVDAVIAGLPSIAHDIGSMVHLDRMYDTREQWACDIAYAQWSIEEMRCGLPLLHLLR